MLPMNELAVLAAVVDAGSLSAAARRLGLSKAAVSDQIKRLEERLGARLINRTTRRLSLTAAGEACYRHSRRMVAEAEAAARAATLLHAEPRGVLRVAAPTTFAPMHIVPALPAFQARHPRLSVELMLSADIVDLVKERFDVAIRIGALSDSRLIARRLAASHLIVCASAGYLRRRGVPLRIGDLADHDAIEFSPLGWRGSWRLVGPGGRRTVATKPVFLSDSGEAVLAAANNGLGVAALPNWMVSDALERGTLVQILPGWGSQPVPIHAVHAGTRQVAAKVRLFIDHIARHLTQAAWRS